MPKDDSKQQAAPAVDTNAPTVPVAVPVAPPAPAPTAEKKPIEEWGALKGKGYPLGKHPFHDAAIIQSQLHSPPGWAQIGTMLTEAEYDAGITAVGNVTLK